MDEADLHDPRRASLGFVWTIVIGSLLHFTFEWSHGSLLVGLFSAVNESVWEHLKLLFVPATVWAAFRHKWRASDWVRASATDGLALLAGLLLINGGYYLYRMFLPHEFVLDLFLFVSAAACTHFGPLLTRRYVPERQAWQYSATLIMLAVFVAFALATLMPPHLPVFQDPRTGGYGIRASGP